jgi:hypothetical protein
MEFSVSSLEMLAGGESESISVHRECLSTCVIHSHTTGTT